MNNEKVAIAINDGHQGKYETYKELMNRYTRAMNSEFCLDAVWIVYAMLEDRLTSALYYAGIVNGTKRAVVTKKRIVNGNPATKPTEGNLREVLAIPKGSFNLGKISGKITAIRKILDFGKAQPQQLNGFYCDLFTKLNTYANTEGLYCELNNLLEEKTPRNDWTQKRNELVHSLFAKKYDVVKTEGHILAESGLKSARQIDHFVNHLKKGIDLRKKYNIQ